MSVVNIFKFPVVVFCVLLTACGGGGGGGGGGNTGPGISSKSSLSNSSKSNGISVDASSVAFEKMKGDSKQLSKVVNITFDGEGVVVGYAPGFTEAPWLFVEVLSTTGNSAKVAITVPGGISFEPQLFTTTLRFVTGTLAQGATAQIDIPVSLFVDEPFDVSLSNSLEFWLTGTNSQPVMSAGDNDLYIHGRESDWSISTDVPWLKFSKASGKGPATVVVSVDATLAPASINRTKIHIKNAVDGDIKSIDASFEKLGINNGIAVNNSKAFEFNFDIEDILIDNARNKMYITDNVNRRLYIVNLLTGFTEKYFNFAFIPANMALSPDGQKLYVSLLNQEHSPYYWKENQTGRIAIMDTTQGSIVNEFRLKVAPGDLVVTGKNEVIVGGGSDQHVEFHFYNATTGKNIIKPYSFLSSPVTHMELLPGGESFYYTVSWQSPPPVYRFDLNASNLSYSEVPSPHGDWITISDFWINPAGTYGVTNKGDVFKTQDNRYITRITPVNIHLKALAFDILNNRVVVITTDNRLEEFDAATWAPRNVLSESFPEVERLIYVNNKIQTLRKINGSYVLQPLAAPSGENQTSSISSSSNSSAASSLSSFSSSRASSMSSATTTSAVSVSSSPAVVCAGAEGELFNDCIVDGAGMFASYVDYQIGQDETVFDGTAGSHIQWAVVNTGDAQHGKVVQVTFNAMDDAEAASDAGWFGITTSRDGSTRADLSDYAQGSISFDLKMIRNGQHQNMLEFSMECMWPCTSDAHWIPDPAAGVWTHYSIPIARLIRAGLDIEQVNNIFMFKPSWGFQKGKYIFQIDNIKLSKTYVSDIPVPPKPSVDKVVNYYVNGVGPDNTYAFVNNDFYQNVTVSEVQSGAGKYIDLQFLSNAAAEFFMRHVNYSRRDMTDFYHGNLVFDIKVSSYSDQDGEIIINSFCGWPCRAVPGYKVGRPPVEVWTTHTVPIKQLVDDGLRLNDIENAFHLKYSSDVRTGLGIQLKNIRWEYTAGN